MPEKYLEITEGASKHGTNARDFLSSRIARGRGGWYDETPRNLEAQLERTQEAVARLLTLLRLKGVINNVEMFGVVDISEYDLSREELRVDEKEYG